MRIEMRRRALDFAWLLFPEFLGSIIKKISGGWVFQKVCDSQTKEIVAYRLICLDNELGILKSVTLWSYGDNN